MIADFADKFDERMVHQRPDDLVVIFLVGAIDLCRDLQRNAASDSNPDGAIDAFFRRNSAEHGQDRTA